MPKKLVIDIGRARDLFADGWSLDRIGVEFGCSRETIRKNLGGGHPRAGSYQRATRGLLPGPQAHRGEVMTTFPMDGPHSPETIREAAGLAAEGIRYLCYATRDGAGGLESPGDAYDVAGGLSTATGRLPQLLTQLTAFLAAQGASGTLGDDQGRDVATLIADASYRLGHAQGAASDLPTALQQAQNVIAGLYVKGGGTDG